MLSGDIVKFDFLYSFNYNKSSIPEACRRLMCSINSIKDQDVNICICNTSKIDIWDKLKHLNNIRYIHVPVKDKFCKSKTINIGVKRLVHSPYFFLSDIDLIYPPNYIETLKNKYSQTLEFYPIRVCTGVYNLGKRMFSNNFQDYVKEVNLENCNNLLKDQSRTWFGISPGNGLIHRDSFYIIRGFDEDLPGKYGGEDALFNVRISMINKYIEDLDLKTIHLFHKINYKADDEVRKLNQRMWRGRCQFIQNKYKNIEFNLRENIKDIQANQGRSWGEV